MIHPDKQSNDPFTAGINYLGLNPAMQTKGFANMNYQHFKMGEMVFSNEDYNLPNNAINNNAALHPRRTVHSYEMPKPLSKAQIDSAQNALNKNAEDQVKYMSSDLNETHNLVNYY